MRVMQWVVVGLLACTSSVSGQEATPPSTERGDALVAEYFARKTAARARQTERELNVTSRAEWEAKKPALRQKLFEMLGLSPLPAKSDLRPVITGRVEHTEFTVDKLHFQSSPGLYVTGNLYLPRQITGPLPTVLYVCGHSVNKKDGNSFGNKVGYQHHGAWYARNGYACLTIDTLQLGEIEGLHHGTCKEGMWWWLSRGYTPAGVEAWNCIRALDYLETRPEVDKLRIGVTGRSGGGAYSWWIAALDERIQVAVPTAGITTLKNHVVDGCIEGHCDCMFQVNTYGWDYALVAALVAPRPLLIANTDKDSIFPLDGVVKVHQQVRPLYELYGKPNHLGLCITEGPHKDTQELQTHEFVWMNRFLKQSESPIDKVAVKFFEPEQLRVFDKLPEDQRNTRIHEEFVPAADHPVPMSLVEWKKIPSAIGRKQPEDQRRCRDIPVQKLREETRRDIRWIDYEFLSEAPFRLLLQTAAPEALTPAQVQRVVLHVLDQTDWERINPLIEMTRSEAEFKLTEEAGRAFLAFQAQCREAGTVQFFMAPSGVGPTEWTRDEKERTHIRRRFALLGSTDDTLRVTDIETAIEAIQSIEGLTGKPLTITGARHAAVWSLLGAAYPPQCRVAGDPERYHPLAVRLELTNLPSSLRDGPEFLNFLKSKDLPQTVALVSGHCPVILRFTQPVAPGAWDYTLAVEKLRGPQPGIGFAIQGP